jgi:hypothetical protein
VSIDKTSPEVEKAWEEYIKVRDAYNAALMSESPTAKAPAISYDCDTGTAPPHVTDRMQGVDCPDCEENNPHTHGPATPSYMTATAAALKCIKQAPLKPTALLWELQTYPYSYTEIQDAISSLLKSGDVVLTPDLFLVVAQIQPAHCTHNPEHTCGSDCER